MLKRKLRSLVPPVPQVPVGDTLPILEPAIEKLAKFQPEKNKDQIIDVKPGAARVISTIIKPAMIDWAVSDSDMLAEAEIPEVLAAESVPEIPAVQAKPDESPSLPVEGAPVLVNAERKPTVHPPVFLARPRQPQRVMPLPPVGTAAANSTTVKTDRLVPPLSSYYTGPRGRRRSAMVVGGCVVLLALGFVGRLVFSDSAPADVQRAAADPPALQKALPRSGKPHVEAPMLKTVKQPESIRDELAAGIPILMPPARPVAPIKAVVDRDDDDDDIVIRAKKPRPALVSKNYGAMGVPLMSTLVISYGTGKVTTSIEPYRNNTVDNRRVSVPSTSGDTGRPRVVKHSNGDK